MRLPCLPGGTSRASLALVNGQPALLVRPRVSPLHGHRRGHGPFLDSTIWVGGTTADRRLGCQPKSSPRYRNGLPPRPGTTASHGLWNSCPARKTRPITAHEITPQGPVKVRLNRTNWVSCLPTDGTSPTGMPWPRGPVSADGCNGPLTQCPVSPKFPPCCGSGTQPRSEVRLHARILGYRPNNPRFEESSGRQTRRDARLSRPGGSDRRTATWFSRRGDCRGLGKGFPAGTARSRS